jgi:hypothetical protein
MFIGLATFMPNSPRQLIRTGKVEDAAREFARIRRGFEEQEVQQEFALMQAQIEYEMEREITSYKEIYKLFRSRVLVYVFNSFLSPPPPALRVALFPFLEVGLWGVSGVQWGVSIGIIADRVTPLGLLPCRQ